MTAIAKEWMTAIIKLVEEQQTLDDKQRVLCAVAEKWGMVGELAKHEAREIIARQMDLAEAAYYAEDNSLIGFAVEYREWSARFLGVLMQRNAGAERNT